MDNEYIRQGLDDSLVDDDYNGQGLDGILLVDVEYMGIVWMMFDGCKVSALI